MTKPLTMFTFGYWGWGTSTKQLIQAVDAVEKERGYNPPLFVDIRIRRAVRAPGFSGNAFQKTIGESRYLWMQDLGNLGILEKSGGIKIKNPKAAEDLLDLAVESAKAKRQVLFFCACEFPVGPYGPCHRTTVAGLVLAAASRRKIRLQIVEWPGGEPIQYASGISVSDPVYKGLQGPRMSIPLPKDAPLAEVAGLAWGSLVSVRRRQSKLAEPLIYPVGPARYNKVGWYLPIIPYECPDTPQAIKTEMTSIRKCCGLGPRVL